MKLFNSGTYIIAAISLMSCGNPPTQDYSTGNQQLLLPNTATSPATQVNGANANSSIMLPSSPNTTMSSGGMNPAHGQPGHRCDIAVGAPLNSTVPALPQMPANNISGQAKTATPMFVSSAPANPVQSTGLNPAHGMPGHRCELAVGAPLNSPSPAQQQTQPINSPKEPLKMPAPTLASSTPAPAAKGPAGLNPAHGQPKHRYDIPVGASLSLPVMSPAKPQASKQATGNLQPQTSTKQTLINTSSVTSNGIARLNPAHGQPGHDCSVAVGQALK